MAASLRKMTLVPATFNWRALKGGFCEGTFGKKSWERKRMGIMDIVLFHDSSTPETTGLLKKKKKKNMWAQSRWASSWSSCFGILGDVVPSWQRVHAGGKLSTSTLWSAKEKEDGLGFLHPIPGHVPSDLEILLPLSAVWHWGSSLSHLGFKGLTDPVLKRSYYSSHPMWQEANKQGTKSVRNLSLQGHRSCAQCGSSHREDDEVNVCAPQTNGESHLAQRPCGFPRI